MLLLKPAGKKAPKVDTPLSRGHITIRGWRDTAEVFFRTKVNYITKTLDNTEIKKKHSGM